MRELKGLEFIDPDPRECDICDNIKVCASIFHQGEVLIICKDCLQEFVDAFK